MKHSPARPFRPAAALAVYALASLLPSALLSAEPAREASFGTPFTRHAVLQRDCRIPVWGTATPGAAVSVKLDDTALEAVVDEKGCWKVFFPPMKAGVGHVLALSSGERVFTQLDDIAIGDVWLCSGQSNMAMNWYGGLTRGREEMERNVYPNIRIFQMYEAFSFKPVDRYERYVEWQPAAIEALKPFSACGYFFGVELHNRLKDVPIGLVNASWGGAAASVWMSLESYEASDEECAGNARRHRAALKEYYDEGGAEGFKRRFAEWERNYRERGEIPADKPDFDDSSWEEVELPRALPEDFDGCAWYRREFTLTAEQAKAEGWITLGILDDDDITYLNGTKIGSYENGWNVPRQYHVPAGLLREGRNVVACRVIDVGGTGGFTTADGSHLAIHLTGLSMPLNGAWKTKRFPFGAKPKDATKVEYFTPAVCYNAMIHPLFPMALKGVLWYQGCSDVGTAIRYEHEMRQLVRDWRANFTSEGELPFYLVQLASFRETHEQPVESEWAKMRWTQMRLGETLGKSGTAVILDVGEHDNIHPKDKKTPGERLARLALRRTYGFKDVVEAGPIPQASRLVNAVVVISFRNAEGLKTFDGSSLKGFQLAGADGKFVWAEARIAKDNVIVMAPDGIKPEKVRYAWDDFPDCNLVNGENLPCGPFELSADTASVFDNSK